MKNFLIGFVYAAAVMLGFVQKQTTVFDRSAVSHGQQPVEGFGTNW